MSNLRVLLVVCALIFVSGPVLAHQQKTAITTILFNPRTENIEVMHRFVLHDAEHAVQTIFGKDADVIGSQQTREQFSQYVHERFSIADNVSGNLPLKLLGHEMDGKFLWVYQETKEPAQLHGLTVQHNALRDLWPTQTNTVNVEGKGDIQTLTFDGNVELLKVTFASKHH